VADVSEQQQFLCRRFGADCIPPRPGTKVGIALQTLSQAPLNALRIPPPTEHAAGTSGVVKSCHVQRSSFSHSMSSISGRFARTSSRTSGCRRAGESFCCLANRKSGTTLGYSMSNFRLHPTALRAAGEPARYAEDAPNQLRVITLHP
jgi:hypothetical protein